MLPPSNSFDEHAASSRARDDLRQSSRDNGRVSAVSPTRHARDGGATRTSRGAELLTAPVQRDGRPETFGRATQRPSSSSSSSSGRVDSLWNRGMRDCGCRLDWAQLHQRTFGTDVLLCPCGGRRSIRSLHSTRKQASGPAGGTRRHAPLAGAASRHRAAAVAPLDVKDIPRFAPTRRSHATGVSVLSPPPAPPHP